MTKWGSWEEDPLDLKCIRLDAEMEQMYTNHTEDEAAKKLQAWKPKTLQDLYVWKVERPEDYQLYMNIFAAKEDSRTFKRKYIPCCILDKENNIVQEAHDPVTARQDILELSVRNNNRMRDYQILCLKNLKVIPFKEVEKYE